MKKIIFLMIMIVSLLMLGCIEEPSSDSTLDLYSEFRMGTFDPAGVPGYDFVDEDAGGIGERFPADRGSIYFSVVEPTQPTNVTPGTTNTTTNTDTILLLRSRGRISYSSPFILLKLI